MRLPPRLCEKGNTLLSRHSAWLSLPVFTPLPVIHAMGSSSPEVGRRPQSTVGLVDLPPELLTMVAAALLRLCYIDSSRYCVPGTWRNRKLPPPGDPFWSAGLVDSCTWAAAAPAGATCRAMREALTGAVGAIYVVVPRCLCTHQPEFHSDDLPDGCSHGDIMSRWMNRSKWLFFFPLGTSGRDPDLCAFSDSLTRFVRACPRLQQEVDVVEGQFDEYRDRPVPFQHVFVLSAAISPPARAFDPANVVGVHMARSGGPNLHFDKGFGLFAPAVEATAAEGGPRLRKRALMLEGETKCYRDDEYHAESDEVGLFPARIGIGTATRAFEWRTYVNASASGGGCGDWGIRGGGWGGGGAQVGEHFPRCIDIEYARH